MGPLSSSSTSASTFTPSTYGCPTANLPPALCASTRPSWILLPGSACAHGATGRGAGRGGRAHESRRGWGAGHGAGGQAQQAVVGCRGRLAAAESGQSAQPRLLLLVPHAAALRTAATRCFSWLHFNRLLAGCHAERLAGCPGLRPEVCSRSVGCAANQAGQLLCPASQPAGHLPGLLKGAAAAAQKKQQPKTSQHAGRGAAAHLQPVDCVPPPLLHNQLVPANLHHCVRVHLAAVAGLRLAGCCGRLGGCRGWAAQRLLVGQAAAAAARPAPRFSGGHPAALGRGHAVFRTTSGGLSGRRGRAAGAPAPAPALAWRPHALPPLTCHCVNLQLPAANAAAAAAGCTELLRGAGCRDAGRERPAAQGTEGLHVDEGKTSSSRAQLWLVHT